MTFLVRLWIRNSDKRIRIRLLTSVTATKFVLHISYSLSASTLSSVLKWYFASSRYFSPLSTYMKKGKDPDPDRWRTDPDPEGPKTCRSPTLLSGVDSPGYRGYSWPRYRTKSATQTRSPGSRRGWSEGWGTAAGPGPGTFRSAHLLPGPLKGRCHEMGIAFKVFPIQ